MVKKSKIVATKWSCDVCGFNHERKAEVVYHMRQHYSKYAYMSDGLEIHTQGSKI